VPKKHSKFKIKAELFAVRFWCASMLVPNKPLVPTRTGEAPVLAAQRRRYVPPQQSL